MLIGAPRALAAWRVVLAGTVSGSGATTLAVAGRSSAARAIGSAFCGAHIVGRVFTAVQALVAQIQ